MREQLTQSALEDRVQAEVAARWQASGQEEKIREEHQRNMEADVEDALALAQIDLHEQVEAEFHNNPDIEIID